MSEEVKNKAIKGGEFVIRETPYTDIFIKKIDGHNNHDQHTVEIEIPNSDVDLEKMLEVFEYFLKASGFSFKGTLDLVEDE